MQDTLLVWGEFKKIIKFHQQGAITKWRQFGCATLNVPGHQDPGTCFFRFNFPDKIYQLEITRMLKKTKTLAFLTRERRVTDGGFWGTESCFFNSRMLLYAEFLCQNLS